jgi:hypothetical protein
MVHPDEASTTAPGLVNLSLIHRQNSGLPRHPPDAEATVGMFSLARSAPAGTGMGLPGHLGKHAVGHVGGRP